MLTLKNFINQIIQGDCFEILPQIPDSSIDLILTDPPYNLEWSDTIELGTRTIYGNVEELKDGWDNVDVVELYEKIIPIFDRILKPTGSVLMFSKAEGVGKISEIGQKNNLKYKTAICWIKPSNAPQVRKVNYNSVVEHITWLVRPNTAPKQYTFNFLTQKEMQNCFFYPPCGGYERTTHPTQKPLALIRHLLTIHSNPGQIVLDPFIGSGTTAVACKQLGRKFIGIEKEEQYCKIALQRLNNTPTPLDFIHSTIVPETPELF